MSDDREKWQTLVNCVASAWNNGTVPGNDEEAFQWARREILDHADIPAARSEEMIALGNAEAKLAKLREALEFYADRETWKGQVPERLIDKDCDGDFAAVPGKRARQSLIETEEQSNGD